MYDQITVMAKELYEKSVALRRDLHRHPETGWLEMRTSAVIAGILTNLGYEVLTGRQVVDDRARMGLPSEEARREHTKLVRESWDTPLTYLTEEMEAGYTGVIGILRCGQGPVCALRFDIDALGVMEDENACHRPAREGFASRCPGVMHACGHDGHAAVLLATVKLISSMTDQLAGEVRFFFQHAEELPPGGAIEMVKAGVMEGVEEVYGLHVSTNYDTCTFGLRSGALTSATDRFEITVVGKGGHSAFPETCVDPIVIGAQIITALQNIVSRQIPAIEPAVLSVCMVNSGQAYNIIPGTMQITGSTRTFSRETREDIAGRIEQIVQGVTASYGAKYKYEFIKGYSSVINDDELTKNVERILTDQFGEKRVARIDPLMPGEDFSAFSDICPGCFIELGTKNPEKRCDSPHHNCNYQMDEDALAYGVEYFVRLIQDRLS